MTVKGGGMMELVFNYAEKLPSNRDN